MTLNEHWIGMWVRRRPALKGRKPVHFVESIVASRIVAKCGRQIEYETPKGTLVAVAWSEPLYRCKQCVAA